jgi:SRSO17 transposase
MGLEEAKDIELRFNRYVDELVSVIGQADRAGPFRDYYVAGIQPQTLAWKPGKRPSRAPKKGYRAAPDTISVKDLALGLRASAWHIIQWREGTNEWLSSRFARVRVHVASTMNGPANRLKNGC